jgi:hypothetical protein
MIHHHSDEPPPFLKMTANLTLSPVCLEVFTFEHGQRIRNDIVRICTWHTKCFETPCHVG